MKISKVIETIDNVRIDELYELIKMGVIKAFAIVSNWIQKQMKLRDWIGIRVFQKKNEFNSKRCIKR